MRSRKWLLILALVLTAFCSFGLLACNESEQGAGANGGECEHAYVIDVAVAPTCESAGLTQGSHCIKCGDVKGAQQVVQKLEHNLTGAQEEVEATCTENGSKAYSTCTLCNKKVGLDGNIIEDVVIQKLGHTYVVDVAVAPTCESAGLTQGSHCIKCGDVKVAQQVVQKLEHSLTGAQQAVDATCTENGSKAYSTCTLCNKKVGLDGNIIEDVVIQKLGHTYVVDVAVAPTCESAGLTQGSHCIKCGDVKVAQQVVQKTGHSIGYNSPLIEATCDEDGRLAYGVCSLCDKKIASDGTVLVEVSISKLGHTFGEWTEEISATCDETGVLGHKTCSTCNKNFNNNDQVINQTLIPQLSHAFGAYVNEVLADCTRPGNVGYKHCSLCDRYYDINNNLLNASEVFTEQHNFRADTVSVENFASPATTALGAQYYETCADCGMLGRDTFYFGDPVANVADYAPKSITLSFYDLTNLTYGVCFNTIKDPMLAVLEITEQGQETPVVYNLETAGFTNYESTSSGDVQITRFRSTVEIPLIVGKTYTYKIIDYAAGAESEEYTFTAVDPNATSFKFANFSDTQTSSRYDYTGYGVAGIFQVLDGADFIVHTGDIVHRSKYEAFWDNQLDLNKQYYATTPMMALAGNHDTDVYYANEGDQIIKHFNYNLPEQTSTQRGVYYSFDYCNVRFIFLNTNSTNGSHALDDAQLSWLTNLLNNNPQKWTIVSMHTPVYSAGEYAVNPSKNGPTLELQSQLTELFAGKVDLVLQGHEHMYQRTKPINGYDSANNLPIVDDNVSTETINGIEYRVNPNGTYYFMNGPSDGGNREPWSGYNQDAFEFVHAGEYLENMWTEIEVSEDTITLVTKYRFYNNPNFYTKYSWGIKKTA